MPVVLESSVAVRSRSRLLFLVAFAVVQGGVIAAACSSSGSAPGGTDAGTLDADPSRPSVCPAQPPTPLSPCTVPEGTTCAFGTCGGTYVSCRRARWQVFNFDASPGCPLDLPDAGAACGPCFEEGRTCGYDFCGDGGLLRAQITCSGAVFLVDASLCPQPDAGRDASDAQAGDAEPSDAGDADAP